MSIVQYLRRASGRPQVNAPLPVFPAFERLEDRQLLSAAYTLVDLGALSGYSGFTVTGLNDAGDAVGYAGSTPSAAYELNGLQAFYTPHGGAMAAVGGANSVATGVNNAGQIVGAAVAPATGTTGAEGHAFVITGGVATDLHDLILGADHTHSVSEYTLAKGINNAGQVVGESSAGSGGEPFAWIDAGGTVTKSFTGRDVSSARAVSSTGVVVGDAGGVVGSEAFKYANGQSTSLGTLAGQPFARSVAYGVNAAGDVVGQSDVIVGDPDALDVREHAFFFTGGQLRDLGTLTGADYSSANDISDGGTIVGNSGGRAFLYSGGAMADLNALIDARPGLVLTDAVAVNETGEIAVNGKIGNVSKAYLLVPAGTTGGGTGSIAGTIYTDANRNAARDAGEAPLAGWTAYVDKNDNGKVDAGEPAAAAGADGVFTITGLTAGKYRVRELRQDGWDRTQPAGDYPLGYYDVILAAGQTAAGKDFGNAPTTATPTPTPTPTTPTPTPTTPIPTTPTPTPTTPTPTPTLGGTLVTTLPPSLVGGAKLKGKVSVVVTNHSARLVSGPTAISLFASTDDALGTGDAPVAAATKKLKLKPGASKTVKLKVTTVPNVPDGSYRLLAQIVAPDGTAGLAAAPTTVAIAAPFGDLAASFAAGVAGTVTAGGKARASLRVENRGNVLAAGNVGVTLYASADATAGGTDDRVLDTVTLRLKLKPGANKSYKLNFTLPADLPAGSYFLVAAADGTPVADRDPTNNTAVAAGPFNVIGLGQPL